MLTRAVKGRLADDVGLWLADGLITPEQATQFRTRYAAGSFGLSGVVKYLGIAGGVFCLFGLLGLLGAMVGSAGFGAASASGQGMSSRRSRRRSERAMAGYSAQADAMAVVSSSLHRASAASNSARAISGLGER